MGYKIVTHRVEMADTGIGREQGFESDKAFLAHMDAERASLPQDVRDALRSAGGALSRSLLGIEPRRPLAERASPEDRAFMGWD